MISPCNGVGVYSNSSMHDVQFLPDYYAVARFRFDSRTSSVRREYSDLACIPGHPLTVTPVLTLAKSRPAFASSRSRHYYTAYKVILIVAAKSAVTDEPFQSPVSPIHVADLARFAKE